MESKKENLNFQSGSLKTMQDIVPFLPCKSLEHFNILETEISKTEHRQIIVIFFHFF